MTLQALERLFDKLVKHKMGGAALPLAGILVGVCVAVEGPQLSRSPFDWWLGVIGIGITAASAVVFVFSMIVYAISWWRKL